MCPLASVEGMNAILWPPSRTVPVLVTGGCPTFTPGEDLHLPQHQLDGGRLGVGRVAVVGE